MLRTLEHRSVPFSLIHLIDWNVYAREEELRATEDAHSGRGQRKLYADT
jgi:hypothetical protein